MSPPAALLPLLLLLLPLWLLRAAFPVRTTAGCGAGIRVHSGGLSNSLDHPGSDILEIMAFIVWIISFCFDSFRISYWLRGGGLNTLTGHYR